MSKSLLRAVEGIGPVKPGNLMYENIEGAKSYRYSILKDEER